MTFVTGVTLIIPSTLGISKFRNVRQIKKYMNRFKSILLGGLLAAASTATLSQNANAAEVKYQHDNFHINTVAVNHSNVLRDTQLREQRARELRERQLREQQARELHERQIREQQARELRERQLREQQARELRERQIREQQARELRERQAHLHH